MTPPPPAPADDDDLLEQWAFLDRMTERQASQLRAGVQDDEEESVATAPPLAMAAVAAEAESMRQRIAELESSCATLNETVARQTAAAQRDAETRNAELAQRDALIAQLRAQIAQQPAPNDDAGRVAALEAALKSETAERAAMQHDNEALKVKLATAERSAGELLTQLTASRAAEQERQARRRWWQR